MAFKGGGGSAKPTKKVPMARVKKKAAPTVAPHTDAQTSGPAYGTKKATAFKETKPYKAAVATVQKSQPANVRYHRTQVAASRVKTQKDGTAKYTGSTPIEDKAVLTRRAKLEKSWSKTNQSGIDTLYSGAPGGKFTAPHKKLVPLPVAKKKASAGSGLAMLNPTALTGLASKGIDKALTGAAVIPGTNTRLERPLQRTTKVVGNAMKDAINIPAEAVPTAYYEGKKLAKGDVKGVVKDLATPYVELAKHPLKTAEEHPLQTYLMAAGVKGGVGRSAGRVARTGALGKTVRGVASTERAAASVPGTALKEKRTYSPDVTVKGRQVAQEKLAARKSRKLHEKADVAYKAGDDEKGTALVKRAVAKDPARMSERQIRRQTVETADANEIERRRSRGEVMHAVDKAVSEKAAPHVSLTVQGITHASKEDLAKYHEQLVEESKSLVGSKLAANRKLRKQIKAAHNSARVTSEKVESSAKKLKAIIDPDQERLAKEGVVPRGQIDRAKLIPYAVRRMGAKHDGEDIVSRRGDKVSNAEITAHMKEHGVDPPVYISQAPKDRNAYYVNSHEAPNVQTIERTGEATTKGTFSADKEAIRSSAVRSRALVDAHKGYSRWVRQMAVRGGSGKPKVYGTRKQAVKAADDMLVTKEGRASGNEAMVPIRLNAFAGKEDQLKSMLDRVSDTGDTPAPLVKAMHDALDPGKGGESGPWALVPRAAVDEQRKIISKMAPSDEMRAVQAAGGAFRGAVLATNPRWLVGNSVEAGLRAGVARAGPRSVATYVKTKNRLAKVDPEAARMLEARATGGGMFHAQGRLPHRAGDQMSEGTPLGKFARGVGKVLDAPGPKQVVGAWHLYSRVVFDYVNKPAETLGQYAMAGKAIRTNGLMDGRLLKLSDKAIDQAAQGLKNTHEQVALGRAVDDMYGKYNKYSPGQAQAIALYTPFISWSINAVNFLTRVLPRDHPVLTGLIASATQASEEWRKDHSLDMWASGKAPLWLQGAIPLADGGWQRAPNRYTPFAIASNPGGTIADNILPQFSSAINALQGRDWKGKELPGGGDDIAENAKAATFALMQSMIPIYSTAKNIKDKGPNAALNPVYPVKPKAAKGPTIRKSTTSTDSGWGGGSSGGSGGWGGSSSSSNGGWG